MYLLAQLPASVLRTQLLNGVVLMVLGMGIVFVFLTILVFTTKGVSRIVRNLESKKPAPAPEAGTVSAPVFSAGSASEAEVAAAITAAVVKSRT